MRSQQTRDRDRERESDNLQDDGRTQGPREPRENETAERCSRSSDHSSILLELHNLFRHASSWWVILSLLLAERPVAPFACPE
jgi:hypothetical protein